MRWLVVAAWLSVGCADTSAAPLEITPIGDEAWNELVHSAADEWSAIDCEIVVVDDGFPVVAMPIAVWTWPSHWLGVTDRTGAYVIAELHPELRRKVLLHELGHALGFSHRDRGIMKQRTDSTALVASDCTTRTSG